MYYRYRSNHNIFGIFGLPFDNTLKTFKANNFLLILDTD